MPPVIIAKDLYKCYPGFPPVLRGVNLTVEPGEIVAIMGPSGCGKSTMLHLLGMLHPPDAGTLEVLGQDVLALGREATAAFRRGNMGFVMQSNNLFDHSTVFENVEFPLIYENIAPDKRWERVIRALELVRLSHRVNYRSNRLSGGEQQRVAVARAMVNNPRILLADEPTGALDARTSKVVMENFRTLAHQGRVAMVVVTHDAGVAAYCDSVYTLEEGILTCRRKDPMPEPEGDARLLDVAPRHLNAACVTDTMPPSTAAIQDIQGLHREGVLARVYALQGVGIATLATGDTHGLPVPVRRQSLWALPTALLSLARHRATSTVICTLWQRVPLRMRWHPWQMPVLLKAFAVGARLASWCVLDKVEHLHALNARTSATAAWVAAKLLGIPFSLTVRSADVCGSHPLLRALLEDAAFVRCDAQTTLDALHQRAPDLAKTSVLLRGGLTLPPPDTEESFSVPMPTSQAEVRLLTIGRLTTRKGIGTLLEACAALKREGVPVRLTIAGGGTLLVRWLLRLQALWLGLRKQVVFLGNVPHDTIPELLQKAHIFLSMAAPAKCADKTNGPPDASAPPTSLIEAMTYALPIVVNHTPGHIELIQHEYNGLIVPPNDAQALAKALSHLIHFPDSATALGAQAQVDALRLYNEDAQRQLAECILKDTLK